MTKLTPKKQETFLAELADGQSVAAAAAKIGVSRQAVYKLREKDPTFAEAWDGAIEAGTDALEDEAIKRARSGSDTLLIFMLKARRPAIYRDRAIRIDLPPVDSAQGVAAAQAAALRAMGEGKITPSETSKVLAAIDVRRQSIELVELENRIKALEDRNG